MNDLVAEYQQYQVKKPTTHPPTYLPTYLPAYPTYSSLHD